jgi:hypothetical protein
VWGEEIEEFSDLSPSCFELAGLGVAQKMFELGIRFQSARPGSSRWLSGLFTRLAS